MGILEAFEASYFYVLSLSNKNVFYIKVPEENNEFLNLETRLSETLDEESLQKIEINSATHDYFYDKNAREIIISSHNLAEIPVFGDNIFFDPEKIGITTSNYTYKYSKPISTFGQFINGILKFLEYMVNPFGSSDKKQDVEISVKKKGTINLIPTIFKAGDIFYVYYYYSSIRKKLFYKIGEEDIALKLKFNDKEPFLCFLNETIFSQNNFYYLENQKEERRTALIDDFKQMIIKPLENNLRNSNVARYYDAMKTLYYLSDDIAMSLSSDGLWTIFEYAIERNTLTNKLSLEEETIFIKLLEAIANNEKTKVNFFNRLLQKKDGEITFLKFLFDRLHGENGLAFCNLINKVWKNTRFINPYSEENKEFKATDGPVYLPYESQKHLGFYFSNASVSFGKESDIKVAFDTGKTALETVKTKDDSGVYVDDVREKSIMAHYTYHPLYPIYLSNIESQETSIKLDIMIPAFMLLANGNQQFWHNVIKTGEYALDIITTFSGIGNIAKFRHLARLGEAGSLIAKIKLGAGIVEVTSGVTNTLLKITGFEDTETGKALQQYLFYLELLSLSGEITVAIKNGLQKSAKEVVEHSDDLEKQLDDLVEQGQISRNVADELLDNLEVLGELDLMATRKIGNLGGKVATEKQIRQLRGVLKQKGINLILEGDIKNALNLYKPIVINGNKFDNPNDLFRFMKDNDFVGGFNAETKQFILPRKLIDFEKKIYENPTEIVLFHEMKHLEHFEEVGEIAYNKLNTLQKETYVWNKILAERGKWTQAELNEALVYINRIRTEPKYGFNLKPITIK